MTKIAQGFYLGRRGMCSSYVGVRSYITNNAGF